MNPRRNFTPKHHERGYVHLGAPTLYDVGDGLYGTKVRGPQLNFAGQPYVPNIPSTAYTPGNLWDIMHSEDTYPFNFDDVLRWRNYCVTLKLREKAKKYLKQDFLRDEHFCVRRGGKGNKDKMPGGTFISVPCFHRYWEKLYQTNWIDEKTWLVYSDVRDQFLSR